MESMERGGAEIRDQRSEIRGQRSEVKGDRGVSCHSDNLHLDRCVLSAGRAVSPRPPHRRRANTERRTSNAQLRTPKVEGRKSQVKTPDTARDQHSERELFLGVGEGRDR